METPSKTAPSKEAEPAAPATSPVKEAPKSVLELLEEDDEFEEFEGTTWEDQAGAGEDGQLWQDDWEDDDVAGDFVQQLRAQIEARSGASSSSS